MLRKTYLIGIMFPQLTYSALENQPLLKLRIATGEPARQSRRWHQLKTLVCFEIQREICLWTALARAEEVTAVRLYEKSDTIQV